jgi:hypothetical protein
MKRNMITGTLALLLWGCDGGPIQPALPDLDAIHPSLATTTTSHFTTFFQATAMCSADIGRIRFSGIIEGVDHTTVDEQGEVHRTRQFRVKGLDGENLDYVEWYRVIGGAEMLTWNSQIGQVPGNPLRSQHAGTLVFEPLNGGSRVTAHHAIRYVEDGQGKLVVDFHEWRCVRGG